MKDLIALLIRFVVAMETIAGSMGGVKATVTNKEAPPEEGEPTSDLDYNKMEHKELKNLCTERGIEVPPRTQASTLRKKLTAADEEITPKHLVPDDEDNFGEDIELGNDGVDDEDDLFDGDDDIEEDKPTATHKQVQDKVKEYHALNIAKFVKAYGKEEGTKKAKASTRNFLKNWAGGAKTISAIEEEHWTKVHLQAEKLIAEMTK